MKRTAVFAIAVCVAFAWGQAYDEAPMNPVIAGLEPAPGGPEAERSPVRFSRPANPGEVDWATVGPGGRQILEDEATIPLTPFIDWDNDVMIDELPVLPTGGKISADVAPNGDIYVAIWAPVTGQDTIYHYRSTDGGQTWDQFSRLRSAVRYRDMVLRIGSDAGGDWIYTFMVHQDAGGLYVRRLRPDLSDFNFIQIVGGDSIRRIAADRNVESPQHLFIAYETDIGSIRRASSSNEAMSWGNTGYVAAAAFRPAIAAGGDGYVYITYIYRSDSTRYQVGRYTNNFISPGMVFNYVGTDPDNRFLEVSVAGARTAPGASQTAILLTTCKWAPNDNDRALYAYTTNGGVSWSHEPWPPTNIARETWRARGPYIRSSYYNPGDLFRGIVTMPEATTGFDSLVYAFSRPTSPSNWEQRDVHNDHRITGEFGGQTDASSRNAGAFIAYRQYGNRRIWFDGYNFTGVAEGVKPVPVAEPVRVPFGRNEVRLSLDRPAPVRVVVFDGAGREVGVVHDGTLAAGEHRLPVTAGAPARGVYFVSVDIAGRRQTGKLVLAD